MTESTALQAPARDYSLVGPNARLAVERGLADAKWYASPVPKEEMRKLLQRRDGPALRDTILWFALLFVFGAAGYALWGTWWAILPFALYGVVYGSSSDSRWHESGHGTAFKTDWLNNALYEIASFMVMRESTIWRWSHTRHHSDTIIVGRDAEIAVPRPVKLGEVALKFINFKSLYKYPRAVALHALGRFDPEELSFLPASEQPKVVLRARFYILIYGAAFALAIASRSVLPLMYIGLPNFYGVWLMVVYGLTQHAGLAENVLDHRLNTRTVYMNAVNRYLYWNMGYHIEHHMFPLVPYHALPRLHELIKADTPPAYHGLLAAYREIVPALVRQSKDPDYFVKRPLPPPAPVIAGPAAATQLRVSGDGRPLVDGWLEVCEGSRLSVEDVLRFDYNQRTYAIYRTADASVYATDGICTHGNAQLADGLVMGNLIECPKHNGRFDVRDGSPQRPPVCVGLRTYDVVERSGKLFFNPAGHAPALAAPEKVYALRVVSNDNVATFIRELVLEPDDGSPVLAYQPGDYLQFDIPSYEERSLSGIAVASPYAEIWQAQGIFAHTVANPIACRRNYSLASNPAHEGRLRFNVRLATPPRGQVCYAGVGSTYVFSLQPGDRVTATGPFGDFHIKPTQREMVYLGGGAGMAPLRSHISYLLETEGSSRRISYWYGARSRQELFYADYFEDLARRHPNFTFHVALSEPQPGDAWSSHTGFIHEVLRRAYLETHSDPRQIEYYLCGPLPMVRAARTMLGELGVDPVQILSDEI